ncbi:MAG: E3 ubiquitin-protein ligase hrd1 [Sclerophora amabilis]|nr:MAG: E3 ubiquitin-protein ligase hrd1 [Sclerophora amabilis]
MRLAAYAGTSTVLATGVIIRAFHQRANFYSACVYLAQSNACLMILTNLVLSVVCFMMLGLQRLLYGPLRPIEIEQLYEKAWFAITETCLAMTIFRDEVGGWFLVMFVGLLIGKVWGWIGEGRVEALEQQPPANPRLFHARLSFSLFVSLVFDIALLNYSVGTVLQMARPNMMVMFAFEFAILTIASSSTAARYVISLWEAHITKQQIRLKVEERRAELRAARQEASQEASQNQGAAAPENATSTPTDAGEADEIDETDIDVPGWEQKGQWVFYLDLATDFFKLVVYIAFFSILLIFYGIPIHIIRDVFLTLRSFLKRIADFLRYRRATRDMNERYPDATAEEIAREETCIICREEMHPWQPNAAQTGPVDERSRPKKLPCNHILHFGCLRSWLERQQICPTCRRSVMEPNPGSTGPRNPLHGNDGNDRPMAWPGQQQPQAGGQHPGQVNGALAQPQNRGRVINVGPLRIGFGVGGPNVFQDLAQQVRNGPQGQAHGVNANGRAGNPENRAMGLGMGFGPNAPLQVPAVPIHAAPLPSLQTQILQLEAQLHHEFNSLRVSGEQLRIVQLMHNELNRLRQSQNGAAGVNQSGVPNPGNANGPRFGPSVASSHVPDAQRPEMGANHPELPPGLNIPPGWSLMPLQRVEGSRSSQTRSASHDAASSRRAGTQGINSSRDPSRAHRQRPWLPAGVADGNGGSTRMSANGASPSPPTTGGRGADPSSSRAQIPSSATANSGTTNNTSIGSNTLQAAETSALAPRDDPARSGSNDIDTSATTCEGPGNSKPAPIWGARAVDSNGSGRATIDGADTAAKTEAASSSSIEPESSAVDEPSSVNNKRSDKGKAKAATVEDFIDEVD